MAAAVGGAVGGAGAVVLVADSGGGAVAEDDEPLAAPLAAPLAVPLAPPLVLESGMTGGGEPSEVLVAGGAVAVDDVEVPGFIEGLQAPTMQAMAQINADARRRKATHQRAASLQHKANAIRIPGNWRGRETAARQNEAAVLSC